MSCDISAVIPPHHIGRLAHPTMRSLFRAIEYASLRGITTEIVIVMDRPDEKTRKYFSRYKNSGFPLVTVDFGDLGLSRNYGVHLSSGKYIAFLDDDNLYCQNWIYKAVSYLEESNNDVIVHPEYHIAFGAENLIWRQISSNDNNEFNAANLIEYNSWDAVCATRKELLLKYPYQTTTAGEGFGFEDWHFNCETLAAGIEHHVIPGTVHFLRKKKSGSLLGNTYEENRILRPNKLFEPAVFSSMLKKQINNRNV